MVPPSASNGQVKNRFTFPPAVTDATAAEPSSLTDDCRITLPIAVMEYCSPIGTPLDSRTRIQRASGRHSPASMRRTVNFFFM